MKVAINAKFGGFSLSPKAVARYAELKGRRCFFFTRNILRGGLHAKLEPATIEEASSAFIFFAYDIPNPDEVLPSQNNWNDLSMEERRASNEAWSKHSIETGRELERHDPALIRVIEELGDAADGKCAKLKIVEIPDGTDYCIEEYDGNEHIAETHQTWS